MQEHYTEKFAEWVRTNQPRLNSDRIRVRQPDGPVGSATYVEFFAESGEAMVEIWDYGFSEFHVWLHQGNPQQEEVKTTHHEFQNFDEMYAALDTLVSRMLTGTGGEPMTVGRHLEIKGKKAEEFLYSLATKTFLTDWCYLNPKNSKGVELCDLLVVFNDTVIIWQVKDLKLDANGRYDKGEVEKPPATGWRTPSPV